MEYQTLDALLAEIGEPETIRLHYPTQDITGAWSAFWIDVTYHDGSTLYASRRGGPWRIARDDSGDTAVNGGSCLTGRE
jgi:hypothetical protein